MKKHKFLSSWYYKAIFAILIFSLSSCGINPSGPENSVKRVTTSGFECPEPNPRIEVTSTEFNLFTWTEYIPADIIECFSLVYNVKVNTDTFSSNEELHAKLTLGKDVNVYDVVHPSDYMIDVLMREGILQKLDTTRIPNLVNLDKELIKSYGDTLKYVVPYQMGTQAIIYNSDKVKTAPKSWADLWNPEYKGRIVAVDDSRVIIGMTLLSLGYDLNTTDKGQLEKAKERLMELMPNIRVFDSDSPKTPLLAGDVDLGVLWNGEAFLTKQENPAFVYVFPTEGSIIFYDGMGIPVNAPHPDVAYAWFNYLLQGDVFWLTLQDYPYTNPNQAALDFAKKNHPKIYDAYIQSPITNTPPVYFQAGHNVKDLGDFLPEYDRVWTEVKK